MQMCIRDRKKPKGKPKTRWGDEVLNVMRVTGCNEKVGDKNEWRNVAVESKTFGKLWCNGKNVTCFHESEGDK